MAGVGLRLSFRVNVPLSQSRIAWSTSIVLLPRSNLSLPRAGMTSASIYVVALPSVTSKSVNPRSMAFPWALLNMIAPKGMGWICFSLTPELASIYVWQINVTSDAM